ncbi:Plasmid maintenance system antidote protein [Parabacteroides distasonis]|nr:pirin [Parabacteroides distasonis]QRO18406.1 pirin [Parabacteroides distasonis]SUV27625.1 Plasmid maintenance system antidote protein [Parabacteroides distasonis]
MDEINIELQKVIDAAVKSSVDLQSVTSVRELYQKRKDELGLTDYQIQNLLGMDKNVLNPIIDGSAKFINVVSVIKLSHFLGVSVNDLIKIYVPEMRAEQIGDIQRAREAGYIVENFDTVTLTKIKFFKKKSSSKDMSQRIKDFFGFNTIYDYSETLVFPVFSKTKRNSNNLIRNFWVQSALTQFQQINNPNKYDRTSLIDLMPKIRPFTRDIENGLVQVAKALYKVGVTVIFQPSIEKLQIRGATFSCNKKPCIVLSDLQKNYPTLWFTLLHELHHVLYDFDEINKRVFHLSSGEGDIFLMNEERADNFATEYLLSEARLRYAIGYINSKKIIEQLAREWCVHSSIIYSIYCYKTNEWPKYQKYIPKMDDALSLLNTHPFEKETLLESVLQIKNLIYNI